MKIWDVVTCENFGGVSITSYLYSGTIHANAIVNVGADSYPGGTIL